MFLFGGFVCPFVLVLPLPWLQKPGLCVPARLRPLLPSSPCLSPPIADSHLPATPASTIVSLGGLTHASPLLGTDHPFLELLEENMNSARPWLPDHHTVRNLGRNKMVW